MNKLLLKSIAGAGLMALLLSGARASHAQTVTALPKLDQKQILGVWYEIARYPFKQEKQCVGDAVELIARGDKPQQLLWVDSCRTKAGYLDARNLTAKPGDKLGDGKYKVITIWPFSRKYWVLAVGPDDAWALVGSPDHKSLWVFSKTPTLGADVLAQVEAQGAAQGYPSARLTITPQTPESSYHPAAPTPPAVPAGK